MGLDDFNTDEGSSSNSSSNSSSSSYSSKVKPTDKPNRPYYAETLFADETIAIPREIKYQIKSVGNSWQYQFSTQRHDSGELVMLNKGLEPTHGPVCVAVFTTITSSIDGCSGSDELSIKVAHFDLEESEILGTPALVESNDGWEKELFDTVRRFIDNLHKHR